MGNTYDANVTKKKIIISRIEMNRYSSFQNRRHNSIYRGLHLLHRKCVEHCAITVLVSFIGSMDSLPHSREIEPVNEIDRVRDVLAVVFDIIDTETWTVGGQVICSCCPCCATAIAETE